MILVTTTALGVVRLAEIDHAVHYRGNNTLHARWKGDTHSKEFEVTKDGYTSVAVLTDTGEKLLGLDV